VRRSDFHFELPPELIAQQPADQRDGSRLLVLYRSSGEIVHRTFTNLIDYIEAGDLLILNNSKVIPARIRGVKPDTGGHLELLLVEEVEPNHWWCFLKPGKRLRIGAKFDLTSAAGGTTSLKGEVLEKNEAGHGLIRFSGVNDIVTALDEIGETPLPPYISRPDKPDSSDRERYQTVYAHPPGSVAAPTAGLHFTTELITKLKAKGVRTADVTLHVGLGTFAPMTADRIEEHQMHFESYVMPQATTVAINQTRAAGGRVIAVGTTSVRVLETVARQFADQPLPERDHKGRTNIFLHPPCRFHLVDALVTNFHLPESTLLMLVSAFAGQKTALSAYEIAVRERYRFFSFGDAMLIL
jgi:S-adenosylmethionine:tRNA ribosyltransferase-isomerase